MRVTVRMPRWRLALSLAGLQVCFATCAPALRLQGPRDEPEALGESLEAYHDTMKACGGLPEVDGAFAITAELTVQGVSTRGPVAMRLWLAADFGADSLRLEPLHAPAAFVFIATGQHNGLSDVADRNAAVVFSDLGKKIQQQSSRALLERLLGVPLSGDELFTVILGCPYLFDGAATGHMLGPNEMRVLMGEKRVGELLVRRDDASSPWTLSAIGVSIPGRTYQWRADYGGRSKAHFRHFRIRSQEWNGVLGRAFDLSFSWNRVTLGARLDKQLFAPGAHTPRPVS
jgi:hypothetical protein